MPYVVTCITAIFCVVSCSNKFYIPVCVCVCVRSLLCQAFGVRNLLYPALGVWRLPVTSFECKELVVPSI